jgi:hypothetical protein
MCVRRVRALGSSNSERRFGTCHLRLELDTIQLGQQAARFDTVASGYVQ